MKQTERNVIGKLTERVESGNTVEWKLQVAKRRGAPTLIASPYEQNPNEGRPISPIELQTGRDFLNSMRAIVFELTNQAVTTKELINWIHSLAQVNQDLAKRAKRSLFNEPECTLQDLPPFSVLSKGPAQYSLPIVYRNQRVAIIDVRTMICNEKSIQLLIIDRFLDLEMGYAEWTREGLFFGSVSYGPHSLECGGYSLAELASSALAVHEWTLRH